MRIVGLVTALMIAFTWGPAAPCPASEGLTSQYELDLLEFGVRRSYLLHTPKDYDKNRPLPLVVALHGGSRTAAEMEEHSGLSDLADREGFFVAYPNGIGLFGRLQHWNAGHCCGFAKSYEVDDVGFVSEVIDHVCRRVRVDPARIYAVGYSNGGMLAYMLAANKPEVIAAVAGISATIGSRDPPGPEKRIDPPRAPIPVIAFNGLQDETVPYGGGQISGPISYVSVLESMGFWASANDCSPEPVIKEMMSGRVIKSTWNNHQKNGEVVLYTLKGWDHTPPTTYFTRTLMPSDPFRNFDAAAIIWEFFKAHPRSE